MLFGDNLFITSYFLMKFSRCVSTFFIYPEKKVQLDPTINENHIDPIIKIAHFCNVMSLDMTLQRWAIFIMGSLDMTFWPHHTYFESAGIKRNQPEWN